MAITGIKGWNSSNKKKKSLSGFILPLSFKEIIGFEIEYLKKEREGDRRREVIEEAGTVREQEACTEAQASSILETKLLASLFSFFLGLLIYQLTSERPVTNIELQI